jgi:hypothetical protein
MKVNTAKIFGIPWALFPPFKEQHSAHLHKYSSFRVANHRLWLVLALIKRQGAYIDNCGCYMPTARWGL